MLAAPPAAAEKAPRSGKPSDATPKKDRRRPCFHFKKHGSCKFGGDEGCRNGTHPAEFEIAGGLPAPMPKTDIALPAGVMQLSVNAGCARSSSLKAKMNGLLKRSSRLCLGTATLAGSSVINSVRRKLLLKHLKGWG